MSWRKVAAFSTALLAFARTGHAAPEHRLVWNEDWPRFHPAEYAATATLIAAGLALEHLTEQGSARWESPLPLDPELRSLLVGGPRSTRQAADFASDVGWMTAQFYPQVVDATLVTFVGDGANFDVAWQLSMMNLEAMAAGFVLTRGSHRLFARERPLRHSCGSDASYDELCPFGGTAASFVSGHTSMSFVGAGLTCVHHRYLPLYGGGAGDLAACAGLTTLATMTGILRVVADRHYASDVIVGAVLGFSIGYGLPWLLHYRHGEPAAEQGGTTIPIVWAGSF